MEFLISHYIWYTWYIWRIRNWILPFYHCSSILSMPMLRIIFFWGLCWKKVVLTLTDYPPFADLSLQFPKIQLPATFVHSYRSRCSLAPRRSALLRWVRSLCLLIPLWARSLTLLTPGCDSWNSKMCSHCERFQWEQTCFPSSLETCPYYDLIWLRMT